MRPLWSLLWAQVIFSLNLSCCINNQETLAIFIHIYCICIHISFTYSLPTQNRLMFAENQTKTLWKGKRKLPGNNALYLVCPTRYISMVYWLNGCVCGSFKRNLVQLFIQYTSSYVITKFLLSSSMWLQCKVLDVNLSGAVTPSLIRITSLTALMSGGSSRGGNSKKW